MRFSIVAAMAALLLAGAVAQAKVQTRSVQYKHGDLAMQGYLAFDDAAQGKRPGVLVVPEWWGLTDYPRKRAEQLAQLGYVAFVADMYGGGQTTRDPKQAAELAGKLRGNAGELRARAATALDVLRKQPQVDAAKVAAIGYCFGGTTVLELARSGADLSGVVSFHGGLETRQPAEKGGIKAKVLVLHGGDDPMVPPPQVVAFMEEMRKAGADWQLVAYGGAVHSFTNPEAGNDPSRGVAYDATADRRSWQAMKTFFEELFARG